MKESGVFLIHTGIYAATFGNYPAANILVQHNFPIQSYHKHFKEQIEILQKTTITLIIILDQQHNRVAIINLESRRK